MNFQRIYRYRHIFYGIFHSIHHQSNRPIFFCRKKTHIFVIFQCKTNIHIGIFKWLPTATEITHRYRETALFELKCVCACACVCDILTDFNERFDAKVSVHQFVSTFFFLLHSHRPLTIFFLVRNNKLQYFPSQTWTICSFCVNVLRVNVESQTLNCFSMALGNLFFVHLVSLFKK